MLLPVSTIRGGNTKVAKVGNDMNKKAASIEAAL